LGWLGSSNYGLEWAFFLAFHWSKPMGPHPFVFPF
jgi:hypothetical protein